MGIGLWRLRSIYYAPDKLRPSRALLFWLLIIPLHGMLIYSALSGLYYRKSKFSPSALKGRHTPIRSAAHWDKE
jgi:hypothetical protein